MLISQLYKALGQRYFFLWRAMMSKIKSVVLKNDKDLVYYQQRVKYVLGIEFPLDYLKNGIVRGFMNNEGELVGGYALILKGELRSLSSIPDESVPLEYDQNKMMEVTALWRDQSVKDGVKSFQFWHTFSRDILFQRNKKYIVYAYDLKNEKLMDLYGKGRPDVLFRGMTTQLEGMSYQAEESIEVVEAKKLAYLPFVYLPYFLYKAAKKQQRHVKGLIDSLVVRS